MYRRTDRDYESGRPEWAHEDPAWPPRSWRTEEDRGPRIVLLETARPSRPASHRTPRRKEVL
jgi:hypothetical protein